MNTKEKESRCDAMRERRRKHAPLPCFFFGKAHKIIEFAKTKGGGKKKTSEKTRVVLQERGTMSRINKKLNESRGAQARNFETKESLLALYRIIITFRRYLRTSCRNLFREFANKRGGKEKKKRNTAIYFLSGSTSSLLEPLRVAAGDSRGN